MCIPNSFSVKLTIVHIMLYTYYTQTYTHTLLLATNWLCIHLLCRKHKPGSFDKNSFTISSTYFMFKRQERLNTWLEMLIDSSILWYIKQYLKGYYDHNRKYYLVLSIFYRTAEQQSKNEKYVIWTHQQKYILLVFKCKLGNAVH